MAALDVSGQSCFTTQSIGRWGLTGGQFGFVVAWRGGSRRWHACRIFTGRGRDWGRGQRFELLLLGVAYEHYVRVRVPSNQPELAAIGRPTIIPDVLRLE